MIKKIKWHNHAILGNLELDFTKPDGTIYDTIVLAGENGTGKTTVLETLSNYLSQLFLRLAFVLVKCVGVNIQRCTRLCMAQ